MKNSIKYLVCNLTSIILASGSVYIMATKGFVEGVGWLMFLSLLSLVYPSDNIEWGEDED